MPFPYTPTARIPAGNPAMLDGPPQNAATQRDLFDSRAHLRQITWGTLVWGGRVAVSGTASHPVLEYDQIDVVALCDSAGVWWPAYGAADTVPESAMSLPLSSGTVYYLYAKVSTSGALGFEVTSSAPDSAVYRTVSAEQRRLLATFLTDGSGNPRPGWMRERGGTYRMTSATNLRVLQAGDATSWASVDLSSHVPPRASVVHLEVSLSNAGTHAALSAYGRAPGDAGNLEIARVPAVTATSEAMVCAARLPVVGRAIEYELSATPEPLNGLSLFVTGWEV